jgi:predicted nucleic acid-binding protein
MRGKVFFDTNIFIYAFDTAHPEKARIADELIKEALSSGNGIISYQVVQEFISVALRKSPTFGASQIRSYLRRILLPFLSVHSSVELIERGLDLQQRYRLSWYDSLIVSAALEANCETLLTEDLQHGQRIDSLLVTNPFL